MSVLCDIGGKIGIGSLESLNHVEVASVRDKNNHDLTFLFLSLFHYRNYRKLYRNRRSLDAGVGLFYYWFKNTPLSYFFRSILENSPAIALKKDRAAILSCRDTQTLNMWLTNGGSVLDEKKGHGMS